MGFVVEEDEAADPVEVLFFCFVCVVFNTQRLLDFLEQFLLARRYNSFPLVVNEQRMRYSMIKVSGRAKFLDIPLLFTFCM